MKRLMIGCLIVLTLLFPVAMASASEVTSTDLIENGLSLDGQTVVYSGEAIGEILRRGDHAWVNVSDGVNAIGIWIDLDMFASITAVGRYGQTGDTLRITGVFHRACQEHGGDLDLHAEQLTVVKTGSGKQHPVSGWMVAASAIFVILDVALLIVYVKRRNLHSKR